MGLQLSPGFSMAFFGPLWRARRGDFPLFLVAALVALLLVPGAAGVAPLPPQSCAAVLFWLQSDAVSVSAPLAPTSSLLAHSHQNAEPNAPQISAQTHLSAATNHCGQWSALALESSSPQPQSAPATPTLERHVVARLSGVRTNRRLI